MVRDSRLHRGYWMARGEHGPLGLGFDEYAARVIALTRSRLRSPAGPPLDDAALKPALERLHFSDLYLAIACDQSAAGAFERFLERYHARLEAFLGCVGVETVRGKELLHDVLGDLASPPPDRRARTRLGTYEGTSSLFSWLAAILKRRRVDLARRALVSSASEDCRQPAERLEALVSREPEPLDQLIGREAVTGVTAALRANYGTLTVRERTCFLHRFQAGLTQRESARRLAIGEPRVSRLLDQAVRKLRRALRATDHAPVSGERAWEQLRDSFEAFLCSLPGPSGTESQTDRQDPWSSTTTR